MRVRRLSAGDYSGGSGPRRPGSVERIMTGNTKRRGPSGLRRITRGLAAFFALLAAWPFAGLGMSRKPPDNQFFTQGKSIPIVECAAGPEGAVCKIRNTGTRLDGVDIIIEPGSLSAPLTLTASLNTGQVRLSKGEVMDGPILEIAFDGEAKLEKPLRIFAPVDIQDEDTPVSAFSIKEDGSLALLVSTPPAMGEDNDFRFSFYSFHPGMFTWFPESP